ncbi:MAG TPA: cupin domain-containing protein [Atribacteraceae bacterium]|nr:cupin domain-containing protein [Atribacteraceae bacterium]
MKIRYVWDEPGVSIPKPYRRTVRMVFGSDRQGVNELSLISAVIDPGSSTDRRVRNRLELIYIIYGKGVFICNDREYPIEADTAVYVEPGDVVQIRNTGEETLKLASVHLQSYRAEDLYKTLLEAAQMAVTK